MLVKKVSYHKIRIQHTHELYNTQMCRNILYPIIYRHVSLNLIFFIIYALICVQQVVIIPIK